MTFNEYSEYDAMGLAALIQKKEVSPNEVLDAAIARYDEINPDINAVTCEMFDEARAFLKTADTSAPLYGVPFLLKDLSVSYAGVPTTNGSRFFKDYIPDTDSEIVTRYKAAGLAIMGKSNTPEFGSNWVTESALLGACRNPYNLSKTPGGSSGGSAAAVAAGIVPAAHASDGGGSIRVPASCCGLIGLKPTRARVPVGPQRGESCSGLSVSHAVTKSVRDSALLLDIAKGAAQGDPYAAPSAPDRYLKAIQATLPTLKIGLVTDVIGGYTVDQDCLSAVNQAARACEALGHIIEDTRLTADRDELKQATNTIWAGNIANTLDSYAAATGKSYGKDNVELNNLFLAKLGRKLSAADYVNALNTLHKTGRDMAQLFEDYDLLLTPTLAQLPVDIGYLFYEESKGSVNDFYKDKGYAFSPFTSLFNITGQPAISLPLYKTAQGMPVGVQFAARFGDELTLLQLARALGL
ncbi:MAG: amidase [Coxiella sp. (in: Bacteria)]|nr:MAG: amidase [Coxiella sp. (in: g-proteobacteria)]